MTAIRGRRQCTSKRRTPASSRRLPIGRRKCPGRFPTQAARKAPLRPRCAPRCQHRATPKPQYPAFRDSASKPRRRPTAPGPPSLASPRSGSLPKGPACDSMRGWPLPRSASGRGDRSASRRGIGSNPPRPPASWKTSVPRPHGRVPSATNRENGCLPAAVRKAATMRSPVFSGHCAGSSASTRTGASPCARRGSLPMQRTRAPVSRCSIRACWRRVPYLPGPLIGQLVSHEGDAVLEGNPRLLEATCNDHRLAPRNRQGSVKRGARDPG